MKAKITQLSEVDSGGMVEVSYEILNDKDVVIFPNMRTQGMPESIPQIVKEKMTSLKQAQMEAKKLVIGTEIIL